MECWFRAVSESGKVCASVQTVQWEGTVGNASLRRCEVGNRWNKRHSDGGQVSERPLDSWLDVFDIGDEWSESQREAGLGSG